MDGKYFMYHVCLPDVGLSVVFKLFDLQLHLSLTPMIIMPSRRPLQE